MNKYIYLEYVLPKNVLMRVHEQRKFDTAILGIREEKLYSHGEAIIT